MWEILNGKIMVWASAESTVAYPAIQSDVYEWFLELKQCQGIKTNKGIDPVKMKFV